MTGIQFDKRWLLLGGAVAALGVGFFLQRPGGFQHISTVAVDATVPPQLTSANAIAGAASASPSPTPSDVAVYVCGAVKQPGVYTFAAGARVVDALKRAGGTLPDADLEQINLAQPLSDAMKVTVPHHGQVLAVDPYVSVDGPATGGRHRGRHAHSRGASSGRHKLAAGQTLDVNTATAEELVQLPGVGPSLAQRIVDFRQQNGPFQTVDDLQNVPGVGPSKFERMAPFVRL